MSLDLLRRKEEIIPKPAPHGSRLAVLPRRPATAQNRRLMTAKAESIFLSSMMMVNSLSVETTSTTLIPSQARAFRT